jgi:pimeloyl-ACP methyl ester carboxylesterase
MQPSLSQSQYNMPQKALRCPRIICLHGGGSNSRIFRISCRVLESQLKNEARFVYADGPFFSSKGPLIPSVFADWGPFRTWLPPALGVGPGKGQGVECIYEDPTDASLVVEKIEQSLKTAMEEDDRSGGTGPWVGLLGFSQGAKVAASLLLKQQYKFGRSTLLPFFSFGVLIAGPAPFVWLDPMAVHPLPRNPLAAPLLRIPTVHVYGTHDSLISSPDEWLSKSCSLDSREIFLWDGDHFVPTSTEDVVAVVESIAELLQRWRETVPTRF